MKTDNGQRQRDSRTVLRISRDQRGRSSPLMTLGTYVYHNRHDIRGASIDVLRAARDFVLRRLASMPENYSSRTRGTVRWLTRWLQLCSQELQRQSREENYN